MKTRSSIHPLAVIVLTAITPFAVSQVANPPPVGPNPATNPIIATGNAAAQTPVGTVNATGTTNPATNPATNISATGQTTVNPTVNTAPASAGVTGSMTGSTTGAAGATVDTRGNVTPGMTPPTPTPGVGAPTTASGSIALDTQATTGQIRTFAYDARSDAARTVESRLDASARVVDNARSHVTDLSGDAQTRLQSALSAVRDRENRLRSSIRAVRTAGRDNYEAARNQLAQDYDAYASAVAQVEASTSVNLPR